MIHTLLANWGLRYGRRRTRPADPAACVFVNLASQTAWRLRDDAAGDGKGGWSDQGDNDLAALPLGEQVFANVPFRVRDACIALRSPTHSPAASRRVEGVRVGAKLRELHFLHASVWPARPGQRIATYAMHYDDGRRLDAHVVYGRDVVDWWTERPRRLAGAALAWEGRNPRRPRVLIYRMAWPNPYPGARISTLDLLSAETDAIPIVVAITGVR